jgi:multicomponent Na+:H+ antiporter subunit G
MSLALDIATGLLLVLGTVFCLIGALGILRLPDYFSRIHAAGLIETLGSAAILAALILQAGLSMTTVKLLLILVFILTTSPTASHALARAALHDNYRPPIDEDKPTSNN